MRSSARQQAIALNAELGSRSAPAEVSLGYALSEGDPDEAVTHLEVGWELCREEGNEAMSFVGGACLAELYAAHGELGRALEIYERLLDQVLESRNPLFATLTCDS